jgi:PPM family protein phosphatase
MIRSNQTHLPVIARTHPGMTGKNNEDRYAVTAYRLRSNHATPALLAVLSDGIGGHRAGEVAAEIVVSSITEFVAESTKGDPTEILVQAVQKASDDVYNRAQAELTQRGMGATCVVAWIIGSRIYAAMVGDSRLYLMRDQAIQQLSTDHTWIQEALERGFLQPDQVRGHPNAHVIRRYLGSPTPPKVDIRLHLTGKENESQAEANQGFLLQPGDRLLLCSDGLTDLVDAEEILEIFRSSPPAKATQALIDLANQRGGHDNITLVEIEVPSTPAHAGVPWTRRIWSLGCLGAVVAALVISGLILGGLWYFQNGANPTPTTAATPAPLLSTLTTPQPRQTPLPTEPGPEIFGTLLPSATPTPSFLLPSPGSPSLTPWPTNTPRPTSTPTATPTHGTL